MKEEIKVLNSLVKDYDGYLNRLKEFYKDKKVLLEDIVDHKKSGLVIDASAVNELAFDLKDRRSEVKLYEVAMKSGCLWAKRNYAWALIAYSSKIAKFKKAITLLIELKVQDKESEVEVNDVLGEAYYKLRQYQKAHEYFKKIPQEKEGKANPDFKDIEEYLAIYKKDSLLKELFKLAGKDKNSPESDIASEEEWEQAREKPWYDVTNDFDGFEPNDNPPIFLNLRNAKIDIKYVEAAVTAVTTERMQAESEKEPQTVVDALKLKEIAWIKLSNEKKSQLALANSAYSKLMETAKEKEYRRQVQTEKHFFSPYRTDASSTKKMAFKLQENRFAKDKDAVLPIEATSIPGRRFLTADLSTLQALFARYGRNLDYQPNIWWNMDPDKTITGQGYRDTYDQCYGNTETIILGNGKLQYHHRINPHSNHVGDFYMKNLGSYREIYGQLYRLSGAICEKEKKIADWMLRYSSSGTVVSLEELQGMYSEGTQEDLDKLMQIFFHCLMKEPMSWMMPAEERHELPFATAQARAVMLISKGHLTLTEVFNSDAPYGVFTGKNIGLNIHEVREKIDRINEAYEACILTRSEKNFQPYFKFKRAHPKGQLVTSRERLHKELVNMYGGGDDTDGEGYDSDTAENLYPTAFEFK